MGRSIRPRTAPLAVLLFAGLITAGVIGEAPRAFAVDPVRDLDYLAVFTPGAPTQPFAILAKPKGVRIGTGTPIEIEAFGLRIAPIDERQAEAWSHRLPELDRIESQLLPPGFKVYGDDRFVEPTYAAGSHTYRITFTDPANLGGSRSSHGAGGTGGGSGGGGM